MPVQIHREGDYIRSVTAGCQSPCGLHFVGSFDPCSSITQKVPKATKTSFYKALQEHQDAPSRFINYITYDLDNSKQHHEGPLRVRRSARHRNHFFCARSRRRLAAVWEVMLNTYDVYLDHHLGSRPRHRSRPQRG
jgi:hypothetical protein